jgi:hypothetical protein
LKRHEKVHEEKGEVELLLSLREEEANEDKNEGESTTATDLFGL